MTELQKNGYKIRYIIGIGWIIIGMITIFLVTMMIILFYPFNPIEYKRVELGQSRVKAGEHILYTAYFYKHTDRVGAMTRYLVSLNGESTIILTPYGMADAKQGDVLKTVRVEIPGITYPGKYKIRWIVMYDYFGIRQVKAGAETPPFMVTK